MAFQDDPHAILWRLHLHSSPFRVHEMLSTDRGRARFWAESAREKDNIIHYIFPNGQRWNGRIIENRPPHVFAVEYFGGSVARFELTGDGNNGTILRLTDSGVPPAERAEVLAGWVSVLLTLKAAVDFDVDLRNHHHLRTWDHGFAEN